MPESTEHASTLVYISSQALRRAKPEEKTTYRADCIICLIFAGFYIEANLNHIIDECDLKKDIVNYYGQEEDRYEHYGLGNKIRWFYSSFSARPKIHSMKEYKKNYKVNQRKMKKVYPGFLEISEFRNNIAHGDVKNTELTYPQVEKLHSQAKAIRDKLYNSVKRKRYKIDDNKIFHDDTLGKIGMEFAPNTSVIYIDDNIIFDTDDPYKNSEINEVVKKIISDQ